MRISPRTDKIMVISAAKLVIEYDRIMVSRDASLDLCGEILGYDQQFWGYSIWI